jgi:uncharacterized Zn finger protein
MNCLDKNICCFQVNNDNKEKLTVSTKRRGGAPTKHESNESQWTSSNDSAVAVTSANLPSKPRGRRKKEAETKHQAISNSSGLISGREENIPTKSRVSLGSDVLSRLVIE